MTESLDLGTVQRLVEGLGTVDQAARNRIKITTDPGRVQRTLLVTRVNLNCDHLIQMSTVDTGSTFELTYHMTGAHHTVISVTVDLPRGNPEIPTAMDLLPAAGIYERQIHDLFGIHFIGHPDMRRIILNEDWPPDEFPLRKDWKPGDTPYSGVCREEE